MSWHLACSLVSCYVSPLSCLDLFIAISSSGGAGSGFPSIVSSAPSYVDVIQAKLVLDNLIRIMTTITDGGTSRCGRVLSCHGLNRTGFHKKKYGQWLRACLVPKNFCAVPITSNLAAHAWSTKCRRKKINCTVGWEIARRNFRT